MLESKDVYLDHVKKYQNYLKIIRFHFSSYPTTLRRLSSRPREPKGTRTAVQHARHVYSIWCALTEQKQPFQILSLLDVNLVKTRWLNGFVETWTPRTTKSYLGSLFFFPEISVDARNGCPKGRSTLVYWKHQVNYGRFKEKNPGKKEPGQCGYCR